MERLEASVIGTVFRNEENGYSVVSVRSGRSEWTVVGVMPELSPGEQAVFTGEWTEHKTYGRQFRCGVCEVLAPSTLLGIERYLGSGLIRGVGPSTAALIVKKFGEETLTVLSEHPERLIEIPGIGKKRCEMISESYHEQTGARQAMVFLQSYGISAPLAMKISQRYGDQTKDIVRGNPYRLCDDIDGVGFRTADRIGAAMGISPDSRDRVCCALKYILQEASAAGGHVFLPETELCSQAVSLLQVPPELCSSCLRSLLLSRELVSDPSDQGSRIYIPSVWYAESETALRLRELIVSLPHQKLRGASKSISSFEKKHGIRFSDTQKSAILGAVENGVFVITGGPGTGKTTIINCVLDLLSAEGSKTVLCAPTGRAAKRMTEACGAESRTIHRLLEYGGELGAFARDESNPLETDCVIADEASMIDLSLMQALLRAMEPGTRLILVGDADQLPSVGAGNVLGDILDSGEIPHVRLTDIFRQNETSRIVVNAHLINQGQMPLLNEKGTDFFFEPKLSFSEAAETIVSLVTGRLPSYFKYPEHDLSARIMRNIQVLAPSRKGDCGVIALNSALQSALNPPGPHAPEISWGDTVFRLGDKVIQTKNDYQIEWTRYTEDGPEEGAGIFNGDVGFITGVDRHENSLTVRFDDEKDVVYEAVALDNLQLAYCLSVHKSQGSEFPVVVMPVVGGPPMLLTRNLLYTAMTRAKQMVVLVGSRDVIRRMVENDHEVRRYTALAERLKETGDGSLSPFG